MPLTRIRHLTIRTIVILASFAVMVAALTVSRPAAAKVAPTCSFPTAYEQKTEFLTAYPNPSMPTSTISKSIYLKACTYTYTIQGFHTTKYEIIRLEAGTYQWNSYLIPENDFYTQETVLCPPNGGTCAVLRIFENIGYSTTLEWGSYLAPYPGDS